VIATLVLDDASLIHDRCLVDGTWTGDSVDAVTDPASGDVIATVPRFGARETQTAIEAAQLAFGPWSKRLAKERTLIMRRWAALVEQHVEDLACILTAEQGKPLAESRGELLSAAAYIDFNAEEARRIRGETIPSHRPDSRILVTYQPIGVVAAITPWNFPAGMVARKVAPALAAGCTVVLKPAPETPLTALALADLALRAGLPPGVLNVVTGDASAIGTMLCEHPAVRFVGFTGSTAVGKLLMRQAAHGVKKLGLELGGHAPFIVLEDAHVGAAVEGAMAAKYRNMGQTCICANRFWVHARIHDEFVSRLCEEVGKLTLGPGARPGVTQGPLINERAVAKVERHIADALDHDAQLSIGGRRHALGGTFFEPTVVTGVTDRMLIAHEETFGPIAGITHFEGDPADVIAQANASPYGLAAYVYGRDIGQVLRVTEGLEYGMVAVNSFQLGTEVAPIGGFKQSGIGREGSHHGILEYCEMKYVLLGGM
jgi:succinate-semialdehyde dehydrogenase/glutarate-semialdehyde dehydrogenase